MGLESTTIAHTDAPNLVNQTEQAPAALDKNLYGDPRTQRYRKQGYAAIKVGPETGDDRIDLLKTTYKLFVKENYTPDHFAETIHNIIRLNGAHEVSGDHFSMIRPQITPDNPIKELTFYWSPNPSPDGAKASLVIATDTSETTVIYGSNTEPERIPRLLFNEGEEKVRPTEFTTYLIHKDTTPGSSNAPVKKAVNLDEVRPLLEKVVRVIDKRAQQQ